MRHLFRIAILLAIGLAPIAATGEIMDRIVAIVNDDIITLREVDRYVRVEKEGKYVSVNEYFRNIQLRDRIDTFVEDILIKQQAKKMKIDIIDKEVDSIVDNIKKQYLITEDQLKEKLHQENVDYKDFYEGLRMTALRGRVITRVISPEVIVTDKMLRDYYDSHMGDYHEEDYRLRQILISAQTFDAQRKIVMVHGMLKQGMDFKQMAQEYSDDPSAPHGGDIGFVKREELMPGLKEAIELLTPGAFTQPIATPYGFHILQLVEVKKGDVIPFEEVKEKIHERMISEESENRYKEYINKLRNSSYIEVKI